MMRYILMHVMIGLSIEAGFSPLILLGLIIAALVKT